MQRGRGGRGRRGRPTGPRGETRGSYGGGRTTRGGRPTGGRDFRAMSVVDGRAAVENIENAFRIGEPKISANFETPDQPEYGPGRVGAGARFGVNYFELRCELQQANQYQIEINCEYSQGLERIVLEKLAEQEEWPNGWVFDGRNTLYTAAQILPSEPRELDVEIQQNNRTRVLHLKMSHTATIPMDAIEKYIKKQADLFPAEAVRILETTLGHAISLVPGVMLHRKSVFFDNPEDKRDIFNGAEAWRGYHQSVRPCQSGLFLNIDESCAPFYKPLQCTDFVKEILALPNVPRQLNPHQLSKVKTVMKNLTVTLVRGNDKRKVTGLVSKPAECMFTHKEWGEVSVLEYYNRVHHPLRFPDLPCLNCSRGKRLSYVPLECASVSHGQFVKKVTERNQEQMIRFAARKPDEKENYLKNLMQGQANINSLQKVPDFQLSGTSPEMKQVNGRVLPSPFLAYKAPPCMDVGTDGQWNLGTMDMTFFSGKKLKSWAILSFVEERRIDIPGENGIGAFIAALSEMLQSYGVFHKSMDPSKQPPIIYTSQHDVVRELQSAITRAKEVYGGETPNVIFCILPRRDTSMYRVIKRASDANIGIPTQCIASDKAGIGDNRPPRGRPQYCANLAMKINVKTGGTNSVLLGTPEGRLPMVVQNKAYMVIGADVSHPAPGSQIPSIAAVVGSYDRMASRYYSRTSMQEAREEIIVNMKASVKGLLQDFQEHNKPHKPESIIVFRDGVSEGFFSKVLLHEYKAIREACAEVAGEETYMPPITYIVIQKRHHTRLFPKGSAGQHRSGNVKPGTVVDSEITSPFGHDFFLCSQAGIQGTVRPAHYHVLVDENNFGSDALQVMCYWMCYMQCRCTKSISVPAPANYAHLAALRARLLAGEDTDDDTTSVGSSGTSGHATSHSFAVSQNKMYYV